MVDVSVEVVVEVVEVPVKVVVQVIDVSVEVGQVAEVIEG